MDYLLGIDVGSTSMKALVYDLDGNVISQGSHPTESIANEPDHPNWQVYLPDHIWDGIASAIRDAVSQIGPQNRIAAAAVTGLGADAVPLDINGEPLYPFINWICTRTTPQFERWLENVGLERTFEISGWQPFVWSTALRFLWLKENEPQIARRVHKWLIVEDFVNYKLTGKYSTDYTDASPTLLFDQHSLTWSDEILNLVGLERDLLPTPQPSGSFVGEVTPGAAEKTGLPPGTPIFQGGHDYLVGALAAGAISPGMFLDVTGTWELVITPTIDPHWTPEIRQLGLTVEAHSAPGMYCIWAGGTAASMLEWYKDQLGSEAQRLARAGHGNVWSNLMDEAKRSQPGANGLFFLPHFNGTSCPNLDPRSLGAFLGLNDTTKKEDMIRAVVEGLDYGFLDMLNALELGGGQKAKEITAIGGGARNDFWMQNKADVSGRPVVTLEIEEATALGAAMLAGVGIGVYKNLEEAAQRVKKPGKLFEPDTKLTLLYTEFFDIYRDIYPALQRINSRIYNRFRV
jgi:xylulokinase